MLCPVPIPRKIKSLYMLHVNVLKWWMKHTLHLTLRWLLLKPSHPDSRIRLAWHDVLLYPHVVYACYLFLQQNSKMSWEVLHRVPRAKSLQICIFHISEYVYVLYQSTNGSLMLFRSFQWFAYNFTHEKKHLNMSQHNPSTTEMTQFDIDPAKKLKRLCGCLPGCQWCQVK